MIKRLGLILLGFTLCLLLGASGQYVLGGNPVTISEGDLYVGKNTTTSTLRMYDGSNNYWELNALPMGSNGSYYWPTSLPAGSGYALTFNDSGIGSWTSLTAAIGGFTLAGTTGTQTIAPGDTLTVAVGDGIKSAPVSATDTVTINSYWHRTQWTGAAGDYYWDINDDAQNDLALAGPNSFNYVEVGSADYAFKIWDGWPDFSGTPYPVFRLKSDGQFELGSGSAAPDTIFSRGAANTLQLATGDNLTLVSGQINLGEVGSITAPGAGNTAIGAQTCPAGGGSTLYFVGDDGTVTDLTYIGTETFWASASSDGTQDSDQFDWTAAAIPVTSPDTCNTAGALPIMDCSWQNDDGSALPPTAYGDAVLLAESFLRFEWTAKVVELDNMSPPPEHLYMWTQDYIVVGVPFNLFPGNGASTKCKTIRATVRFRVNDTALLENGKLTLNDYAATPNTTSQACNDSTNWTEVSTGYIDVSSWTQPLFLSFSIYGTNDTAEVLPSMPAGELTQVDIMYLAIEEWAR